MLEELKRIWISLLRHSPKTRFKWNSKRLGRKCHPTVTPIGGADGQEDLQNVQEYGDVHTFLQEQTELSIHTSHLTITLRKSRITPEPVGINFCMVC